MRDRTPLEHRRLILRGHAAVSTSARRPGGRIDRGRATGLPVAPIRLRRRERADGSRTPTDFRQDPRTRNDVQDADESLASWTRHRIGVRQRHRRRIAGAPARFTSPFGQPRPHLRSAKPDVATLDWLTIADQSIGCDCLWALALGSTYLHLCSHRVRHAVLAPKDDRRNRHRCSGKGCEIVRGRDQVQTEAVRRLFRPAGEAFRIADPHRLGIEPDPAAVGEFSERFVHRFP